MSEKPKEPAQHDQLLEHEYDGIQEYDNPLPRWWLQIFWVSIAWSVLYFLNVPGIGVGKGRIAAYERDMAAWRARYAKLDTRHGPDAAALLAAGKDPQKYALGKATFATNCMPCHGPEGGGVIGPNLTDDYWLHGGAPEQVYKTVHDGVLAKGMPAWGQVLPPDKVEAVAAYVITLHGTHPANPKPPQGDLASAVGTIANPAPGGVAGGTDAPTPAR